MLHKNSTTAGCDVTPRPVALQLGKTQKSHSSHFISCHIIKQVLDHTYKPSRIAIMSSVNAQSTGDEQEQTKTYKEQLDEAAVKATTSQGDNANQDGVVNKVVEKGENLKCLCDEKSTDFGLQQVSEYVPAVGKVLGQENKDTPPETESKVPGPPELPHHATQVEEFVRDQHRSRIEDGKVSDE